MLEKIAYYDERLFLKINNSLRSPFGDIFLGYSTWLGDGAVLFVASVILAYVFDRPHFKRNFILISVALLLGGLMSTSLKAYFDRMRPLAKFGGWRESGLWHPGPHEKFTIMFEPFMYNSFPSGHCAGFFSVATIVSLLYKRLSGLMFLTGFIVMLSRIYVGVHFPLDTLGGAAVGALSGFIVFKIYRALPPSISKFWGDAGAVKRTRL